ncbi:MAG: hypothetical protein R3C62_04170 [Chloroflexota bacterium]
MEYALPAMIGLAALIVLTGVFIVLEGYLLYRLKYGSFGKGISKAVLLNLVSAFLGLYISTHRIESGILQREFLVFDIGNLFAVLAEDKAFWKFLFSIPTLIWWILIEGVVLMVLFKSKPRRTIWQTAVIINVISYAIVFFFYVLVFIWIRS